MPDVLFILLLALVIFGPRKLPEIAGQIGKHLAQFRRLKSQLLDQISGETLLLVEQQRVEQEPDRGSQIKQPVADALPEALAAALGHAGEEGP